MRPVLADAGRSGTSSITVDSPRRQVGLIVTIALVVGLGGWWLFRSDAGACEMVRRADVSSVVGSSVSAGEELTDDSQSGGSGCGFKTQSGAVVSVWIGTDDELGNVLDSMRANGDKAAGSPEAYVYSLGADGESAVTLGKGRVVLVNAPGHLGAAARLAQLIATDL